MSIEIRPVEAADAPSIAEIYRPIVESTTISFEEIAPDAGEIAQRIARVSSAYPWFVAVRDAEVCGYAYGSRHRVRAAYRFSADVSVYVAEHARGMRVASRLYEAVLARLGEIGMHRAFAGIALPNGASLALHRSMGFESVGIYKEAGRKFGKWIDVQWKIGRAHV